MKTPYFSYFNAFVLCTTLVLFLTYTPAFGQSDWSGRVQGELKYYGLNASVETWTFYDETHKPTKVGFSISETFVDQTSKMVSDLADDMMNINTGVYFDLQFPEDSDVPFEHGYFSYHPKGHVLPGIYDMAHFDFHFYTVPSSARKAMTPEAVESAMKPVEDGFLPDGYRAAAKYANFYAPYMGTHFIHESTPEAEFTSDGDIVPGKEQFTQTFIYGTFDGSVVFYEPMMAASYMESIKESDTSEKTIRVRLPKMVDVSGWYPTSYRIKHYQDMMTMQGYYDVSMEDFVWMDASKS